MNNTNRTRCCPAGLTTTVLCIALSAGAVRAVATSFFDAAQTTDLVATNATSDTINSDGYWFTYTRDKFFTGGTTNPPGRYVRIFWPEGLEAQYVTAGPNPGKAKITVGRLDGAVFDLTAFTAKLLANAGAGRAIEIVPLRNGEEPLNDPLYFDVSGSYGSEFAYDTSLNYLGTTAALTNYDAYVISLTLDYALMSLTVVDASIPPPVLAISQVDVGVIEISWPATVVDYKLEISTNLSAPVWDPVTDGVTIRGDRFTVLLPVGDIQQFYRLRR